MNFVKHIRDSAPYIQAHRGSTIVVWLPGELLTNITSQHLSVLDDILLLHHLGCRVVLVHGARPQIDENLFTAGIPTEFHQGWRVTSAKALENSAQTIGQLRFQLEAQLSKGLPGYLENHQMPNIVSGNFIVAKPVGVRGGVDMLHTGELRQLNTAAIQQVLQSDAISLISPLGHSLTGELFNLSSLELAVQTAAELKADKLVLLSDQAVSHNAPALSAAKLKNLSTAGADNVLEAATAAVKFGVERVHVIDGTEDGALLTELYTRDGNGLLITESKIEQLRAATLDDTTGILALIEPLVAAEILAPKAQQDLEQYIGDYRLLIKDGLVIACAALHRYEQSKQAELASVAVHEDYRQQGLAAELLNALITEAKASGIKEVFVLTTQTEHWFIEHGFAAANVTELPVDKQAVYNQNRKSKVLKRTL